MKIFELLCMIVVCFKSNALRLPGPQVYVVTPSSRQLQIEVKSPPFYYQNWMRRMDTNSQISTTSTAKSKVKTPDLIFAELESDDKMQKSIRKLLEKEKVTSKTTTVQAIYVPDEETTTLKTGQTVNEIEKLNQDLNQEEQLSENNKFEQSPVYLPTGALTTTTRAITTTPVNIENIWHIIDNEKLNQHQGNWDEIPITNGVDEKKQNKQIYQNNEKHEPNTEEQQWNMETEDVKMDDNFALPGFGKNPGIGAENESRAMRNEQNLRFPYVNLKPFQMKTLKKPLVSGSSKKTNMIDLSNFYDLKEPVRGEAQDLSPVSLQVDRYNPAQPYLPKPEYGSNLSKQNSPISSQGKFTANLVPPPPVPKITGDDFPSPSSYESFPPYPPSSANLPSAPQPESPPMSPSDDLISSDDDDNGDNSAMDLGYRYKPPSAPRPQFIPTVPPPDKFEGYSYNKPSSVDEMPSLDKPDLEGYHYNKPGSDSTNKKPDFKGYEYSKPDVPQFFDQKPSYGPSITYQEHNLPHSNHDLDYPELIYNKPHGDMNGNTKDNDDMKGVGMMPPPPPTDLKPQGYGPFADDHGFPGDFPDVKYHDFDDHDHYHHHHTTTTTTTEMPRVNRYSYYYLGKKLYYLPLYFSVYFIIYVGALIIKAVLRHKITYPNSWRPNDTTATFFSKRSVDNYLSNDNLHEMSGKVTHAIATAAEKYMRNRRKT